MTLSYSHPHNNVNLLSVQKKNWKKNLKKKPEKPRGKAKLHSRDIIMENKFQFTTFSLTLMRKRKGGQKQLEKGDKAVKEGGVRVIESKMINPATSSQETLLARLQCLAGTSY